MEIQELFIGRGVNKELDVMIPQRYERVSNNHVKATFKNQKLTIDDLNSRNGTFVNGIEISTKSISESDIIWLGGIDQAEACQINTRELFQKFTDDYSLEFDQLKTIYDKCHKEIGKLKIKINLPKIIIPSSIVMILVILRILGLLPEFFRDLLYPIISIASVIATVLVLSKSSNLKDKEEIIYQKYEDLYVCPKCKTQLNLKTPSLRLKKTGVCPHKCGAKYI